ncbi:PTS system IIA component, Glc family [Selenomonas ruminantium]|uniref:PTS system IIA component, Glc family n=1 Tax=Selenomonas ruminantium TaxID=971 RepID=A0A1M6WD72_SELRU|nr:PTS glucose transporter subunit IIA [Selenomonas ruminantium]SHK91619.1 PTS system IIA component, Glc family [Selenomonas ruminantium]
MTAAKTLCQVLLAPFSGKTMELASVPDPVFAEKLTGDGLAIELNSDTVLAPCDGVISLFFDTKHAFAITTDDGIQILVHVGLDSIILNGEGLTALKKSGDRVTAGTPIIKLDLDVLKKNSINMISPVLIVNYDKVSELKPRSAGCEVAAGNDEVLQYAIAI